ncbi:hypothetical protein JCM5296_004803 [Sporobolomyces johnsonii]
MKTSTVSLALLSLVASSNAQGIIDNIEAFAKLALESIELNGDYYLQNAQTGQYLYFDRPGDTTNLITGSSQNPITLGQDSAYGQSGELWDTWSGTYLTGLEKCMSSQWGGDVDAAAVSYACKVGPNPDGTDTLEVAKQFWKLIPCGSDDDSDDSSSSSSASSSSASASATASSSSQYEQLNVKVDSSDSAATASWSSDDSSASATSTSSASSATQSVNPEDRSTWVCRHPAKWLLRHPAYVTEAGHIECKTELEAAQAAQAAQRKRSLSSHQRMTKYRRSEKRSLEKRDSQKVCIIAVDHATDMNFRALSSEVVTTAGDYLSVALADYDSSDEAQHWIVTSAN